MKRFSLRLEDDIHKKLSEYSFFNKISMNDILIEALEKYFKEKNK